MRAPRPLPILLAGRARIAASVLALACAPSWAVLGGDIGSVQADQVRMKATRIANNDAQGGTVHEIRMPDGSSIRQFVNSRGVVYAVAWSTRLKPDFAQLLGRHSAEFDAGVSADLRSPGIKRSAFVDRDDLVVNSAGRLGAFVGRAWLKSQVPVGTRSDAIR